MIHHVMVLVHGIMGNSRELGYVHHAFQRDFQIAVERQGNSENSTTTSSSSSPTLLVHSATCNEKDSLDGIEAGGLRLANEINSLLQVFVNEIIVPQLQQQQEQDVNENSNLTTHDHKIALSILGFSLGGMYARYSLPFIEWEVNVPLQLHNKDHSMFLSIPILPNIFVTAATPHLGIQQMTYWRLPKCLEPVVARYLGQTGRDLFRRCVTTPSKKRQRTSTDSTTSTRETSTTTTFTFGGNNDVSAKLEEQTKNDNHHTYYYDDLIQQMSLDPKFLIPLSKFAKRIAFANAFSTDFAVHTATAAFLTDDDDEKQHEDYHDRDDDDDDNDNEKLRKETPSAHFYVESGGDKAHCPKQRDNDEHTPCDFPMATFTTLASWSPEESLPLRSFDQPECHIDKEPNKDDDDDNNNMQVVPGASITCPQEQQHPSKPHRPTKSSGATGTLSEMATTLNSLGWTKIFVDVRPHIPALWRRARPKELFHDNVGVQNQQDEDNNSNNNHKNKKKRIFSPAVLKKQLSGRGFDFNTLPFGHSLLIASTKNWWYTWFYRDGRKFVDQFLTKELVEEMLRFCP